MSKSQQSGANGASAEPSYFEQQRGLLVRDIGESMERVLQNLNKLNRSLEGIIAVGNEFSSVEALWSHFEGVMAKDPNADGEDKATTTEVTGESNNASTNGKS